MDRVIFCPSEKNIDEASTLAREFSLPILIGENEYTKNLLFDREKTQKLLIPKDKKFSIFFPVIKKNFHQIVEIKNDFCIIKNNIKLLLNDINIKSLYEEKYFAKYVFIPNKVGQNVIKILINEKEEFCGEFEVI